MTRTRAARRRGPPRTQMRSETREEGGVCGGFEERGVWSPGPAPARAPAAR